jgi:hypothetical protein
MKKLFILLTVLLVLGSACKKGFLNVDETNPNSASSVPASLVLPAALNYTSILMNTPGNFAWINQWYGLWSISGGYSQDASMTGYNEIASFQQVIWDNAYIYLQNIDYLEKNSTGSNLMSYRAIAKIMKAYIYQNLVDIYGNIPYSQALKTDQGILKPKFDDQKAIYEDLVVQLDTAMNIIATTPAGVENPSSKDIIYGGDMAKWQRFANTLKLRMLMNQADMSDRATYIKAEIAATSSIGYLGAGEGAWVNPGYLQSTGQMNPFWERFYNASNSQVADGLTYFVAGQDACEFLINNNDPRKLRFFALPTSGADIKGNYFGVTPLQTVPATSHLGPGMLLAFNQNAPILTDMESLFLQAEAAQRGLISGSAKAFYEAAVTQSVIYEGKKSYWDVTSYVPLTAANAAAYLAQSTLPLVNFDASLNPLKTIITQKWCAMNGLCPMVVWTDYRRTGYPDFIHFSKDANRKSDYPPVRLIYPQTEVSLNNDNVVAQGTIDFFSSKIFWQNR